MSFVTTLQKLKELAVKIFLNIFSKLTITTYVLLVVLYLWMIVFELLARKHDTLRQYLNKETYECIGASYDVGVGLTYFFGFILIGLLFLVIGLRVFVAYNKKLK